VGRGALAGPVVAAAVVLPPDSKLLGVNDSKTVEEEQREALFETIVAQAVAVGIGLSHAAVIDRINVLNASLAAMTRAVGNLGIVPKMVLVDGRDAIESPLIDGRPPVVPVIGGDSKSLAIAAASIVAKVTRDRLMRKLHQRHPEYNFLSNKGYGTKEHIEAISRHGALPEHRKSYRLNWLEKEPSLF
jgi:ribonuclease HII